MAEQSLIDRIAKLLRLAEKHPDTPEGKSARAIALRLMAKHGIEVELGDIPIEQNRNAGWVDVERYPKRDLWRDRLADLVSTLFEVSYGWRPTIDGEAQLGMRDPLDDDLHLQAAIRYFRTLENLVEASQPGIRDMYGNTPWVVDLYRRGIVDAMVQRLGNKPRAGSESRRKALKAIQDHDVDPSTVPGPATHHENADVTIRSDAPSTSTALVHVRKFTAPREEAPPTPVADVPVNEGRRVDPSPLSPSRVIYMSGFTIGQSMWIPPHLEQRPPKVLKRKPEKSKSR